MQHILTFIRANICVFNLSGALEQNQTIITWLNARFPAFVNGSILDQVNHSFPAEGGGGALPYESDGDARRKIRIKHLTETNLGVAQAFFDP